MTSKEKKTNAKYIAVGLIAATVTVIAGTSSPTIAKSRRLNPSTNCVRTSSGSRGPLFYTEDGSFLSARASPGTNLLCDIPSDGYLRHHSIRRFNVHGSSAGAKADGTELKFRVCITDYRDNFSTVCGRFTEATEGDDTKTKLKDLDVLRHSGRKGWFPVMSVSGLTEIASITGYYIGD